MYYPYLMYERMTDTDDYTITHGMNKHGLTSK